MSFARVYRVGVWFGFARSALLLAVAACIVLSFEAMPGLCCFLRVTLCPCGIVSCDCLLLPLLHAVFELGSLMAMVKCKKGASRGARLLYS